MVNTDSNVIVLPRDLDHYLVADRFNSAVRHVIERLGFEEISLRIDSTDGRHFPNASVPIAATLSHYRDSGIAIHVDSGMSDQALAQRYWASFLFAHSAEHDLDTESDVFTRIWEFNENSASRLAEWVVSRAQERIPFGAGVFEAFNWALWEVMDNVLQHSERDVGFIEAQIHPATLHLAVCVADAGRGVRASFGGSQYRPGSDADALTLAIREGVTRDPHSNQGNGLWGLAQIVRANSGNLQLTSGRGRLELLGDGGVNVDDRAWAPAQDAAGMIVDFQLSVDRPINLPTVLGHMPVTLAVERFADTGGDNLISIREHSHGTGTRQSAAELRILVTNLLTATNTAVDLDFVGVPVVSSSFADELVGKLVVDLGFYRFLQQIRLRNVNETVGALIDRAVRLRMSSPS